MVFGSKSVNEAGLDWQTTRLRVTSDAELDVVRLEHLVAASSCRAAGASRQGGRRADMCGECVLRLSRRKAFGG